MQPARPALPHPLLAVTLLLLLLTLLFAPRVQAQAVPTATRTAEVAVFGGFANGNPDYGPYRNNGAAVGVNFTRFFHFPVAPSVEGRANFLSGTTVTEHTYLFGLRAQIDVLKRFHPYADVLAGPGNIHFNFANEGYTGDNSTVYSYGGGVDVDVLDHVGLKLDYQGQHWNTGEATYAPSLFVIGVSYRVPFRPHVRQGEINH